jgi:hypothetical protein
VGEVAVCGGGSGSLSKTVQTVQNCPKVQQFCPKVQKSKNPKVQNCPKVQKSKSLNVQNCPKVQKSKNPKA